MPTDTLGPRGHQIKQLPETERVGGSGLYAGAGRSTRSSRMRWAHPRDGQAGGMEGPFQVGCAPGASAEGPSLGDAAVGKGEMSVATT